jgi:hypothetical protein
MRVSRGGAIDGIWLCMLLCVLVTQLEAATTAFERDALPILQAADHGQAPEHDPIVTENTTVGDDDANSDSEAQSKVHAVGHPSTVVVTRGLHVSGHKVTTVPSAVDLTFPYFLPQKLCPPTPTDDPFLC